MTVNISFFQTLVSRPVQVPIQKALEAIKNCVYDTQIQAIRKALPEEQEWLKKSLPSVTFGGTFSVRKISGLIEASGFLCLDFDVEGIECPETLLEYAYAIFRSPRGGLKVIIRIPQVSSDKEFKELFLALQEKYPDLDPSGKDISRLCFMSSDPDLIINEQAKMWIHRKRDKETVIERPEVHNVATQTNWAKATLILKMLKTAQVGNRHNNCLKAGQLCGGYLATQELSEGEVELFVREIEATSTEPKDHVKAFMDGVVYGKNLPLHSSKRGETDVHKLRKSIKEEWKNSDKMGDIYFSAKDSDIEKEIRDRWKNGKQRGSETGWDALDQLYSVMLGYMTIIYGSPFQGKSLWAMGLLINLSRLNGWCHILFTPEMGTPAEVVITLIQIYCEKDLDSNMTEDEYNRALDFIDKHFLILDNEESGNEIDMEGLCLYADFMERKMNKKFHTLTVDPLIELRMSAEVRDDLFWNGELKKARVMAKASHRHLFLIHHTKDMGRPDGRDEYGNPIYRQAGPSDLAFGQTFYRKAFFMINVWHHYCEGARQGDVIELKCIKRSARVGYTYVKVVKAKPEGAGRRGEVELRYDGASHNFYDESGNIKKVYAPERDTSQSQNAGQQEISYDEEGPMWLNE
jgi:hypothetical protein